MGEEPRTGERIVVEPSAPLSAGHENEVAAPAPGELETVRSFLSLHDHEPGNDDDLPPTPATLEAWIRRHELVARAGSINDVDLRWALEVRAALKAKVDQTAGAPRDHDAVETLNRAAQDTGLQLCFGCEENRLHTEVGGVRGAIGRVLGTAFLADLDGSFGRLRECHDPSCSSVFYDHRQEPLRQVVLDGGMRQPQQGQEVPSARTGRLDVGRISFARAGMNELTLPLIGPGGEPVDLARTLNSHGFSDLAPIHLDERAGTLELTLRVSTGAPRRVSIGPESKATAQVQVSGPRLGARARADVLAGVRHVLRLDQDLSGFYAAVRHDPDLAWAALGAGRMIQSPTAFEDAIKTVCTTNCTWSATVRMVNALVTDLGEATARSTEPLTNAFPTPSRMAEATQDFYRDIVRAGYRGPYMIELARLVASGEVDLESMAAAPAEDLPDDELERMLLALPGVGPYAAAHIMMTMGRSSRLILDSWTRPTYARVLGRSRPVPDATIRRRFRRYGDHAGLAFWLLLTRDWLE